MYFVPVLLFIRKMGFCRHEAAISRVPMISAASVVLSHGEALGNKFLSVAAAHPKRKDSRGATWN